MSGGCSTKGLPPPKGYTHCHRFCGPTVTSSPPFIVVLIFLLLFPGASGTTLPTMTAIAWPSGFSSPTQSFTFQGGVYASSLGAIFTIPYNEPTVLKLDTGSNEMTSFSNKWPPGMIWQAEAFQSGSVVGSDIWFTPYNVNVVVKMSMTTGDMVAYSWPSGYVYTQRAFIATVAVGQHVFLAPWSSLHVIKIDTVTGIMTAYDVTFIGVITALENFYTANTDRTYVWMIPYRARMVLRMDASSGAIVSFSSWPDGVLQTKGALFEASVIHGRDLWLLPAEHATMIRMDMNSGAMYKYETWPSGTTNTFGWATFSFGIVVDNYLWLMPKSSLNHVIQMDLATNVATTHSNWPSGFARDSLMTFTCLNAPTFDQESLWMVPGGATHIIKMHIRTLPNGTRSETFSATLSNQLTRVPTHSQTTHSIPPSETIPVAPVTPAPDTCPTPSFDLYTPPTDCGSDTTLVNCDYSFRTCTAGKTLCGSDALACLRTKLNCLENTAESSHLYALPSSCNYWLTMFSNERSFLRSGGVYSGSNLEQSCLRAVCEFSEERFSACSSVVQTSFCSTHNFLPTAAPTPQPVSVTPSPNDATPPPPTPAPPLTRSPTPEPTDSTLHTSRNGTDDSDALLNIGGLEMNVLAVALAAAGIVALIVVLCVVICMCYRKGKEGPADSSASSSPRLSPVHAVPNQPGQQPTSPTSGRGATYQQLEESGSTSPHTVVPVLTPVSPTATAGEEDPLAILAMPRGQEETNQQPQRAQSPTKGEMNPSSGIADETSGSLNVPYPGEDEAPPPAVPPPEEDPQSPLHPVPHIPPTNAVFSPAEGGIVAPPPPPANSTEEEEVPSRVDVGNNDEKDVDLLQTDRVAADSSTTSVANNQASSGAGPTTVAPQEHPTPKHVPPPIPPAPPLVEPQGDHHDTRVPITGVPPARCFRRCPQLGFVDALTALLSLPQPPNRPDLDHLVPDEDDANTTVHYVHRVLPDVKATLRDAGVGTQLSDDEICALIAYKIEIPYPVYKWLNSLLVSSRRDSDIIANVGPFFTLLYRAMEKLPPVSAKAARAVIVGQIPALQDTFDHYTTRLAVGKDLNFWGFSSFSTDDKVINSKAFIGSPQDKAIVYTCPELTGVDMELFKPPNATSEAEILPLPPAMFKVTVATMVGNKLTVVIKQVPNDDDAYVVPSKAKSNRN